MFSAFRNLFKSKEVKDQINEDKIEKEDLNSKQSASFRIKSIGKVNTLSVYNLNRTMKTYKLFDPDASFIFGKDKKFTKNRTEGKVIPLSRNNSYDFFKWFECFNEDKMLKNIIHNYNIQESVGWITLAKNNYATSLHFLRSSEKLIFSTTYTPLNLDGSIDTDALMWNRTTFKDEVSWYKQDGIGNSFWILSLGLNEKLSLLADKVYSLGFSVSKNAELVMEFLKYDHCIAMFYKYKSKDSDKVMKDMLEGTLTLEELSKHIDLFINNDEFPINLDYEILAAVAFSLKKNGSLIKFNTLEDLYFKIRRQYIESQRNQILPHNINVEDQNVEDQYEALYSNKNNLTRSFNYEFDELNPFELEEKVALLYEMLGYKSEATKKSGDQGADVIIVEPKTGIKSVIQIKKYTSKVSNSAIQQVIAAKAFYNAQEAIVMTTNYFTKSAIDLAENTGVILYDRDQFSAFISRVSKL